MAKLINIKYLEGGDFNSDGSLKGNVNKGQPCVVMMQGEFCGYCTKAKPAFQEFSKTPGVVVATIQIDGEAGDRAAAQAVSKNNTAQGVPAYMGYDRNGKFVKMHEGGRDVKSLQQFAKSL